MAIGVKLPLIVLAASALMAIASVAQADNTSPPPGADVCTPTSWHEGCTSPIDLNGLVQLLGSPAANLPPLRLLTSHFLVWADDCITNLGSWAKADGIGVPGQVLELSRAASAESKLVQAWLADLGFHPRDSNVTLTLFDGLGTELQSWHLTRVIPISWTISAVVAGSKKVAIETLELHYGALTTATGC